jgi:hypothetical protein
MIPTISLCMKHFLLHDVPLSQVRHNDLPCYIAEGYGGQSIEVWPMYKFFSQYLSGEKEVAIQNFEEWYREQLTKYCNTPKSEGGMYRGSLYTRIVNTCGGTFDTVETSCKNSVIRERVRQRFALLEAIQKEYRLDQTEPIHAIKKSGGIYLVRGHHRAAVLYALGRKVLPGVLVFPNQFIYNLVRFIHNIRYGNFHK